MDQKHIDVQVGIYDTAATLTPLAGGAVELEYPFIKWVQDNGSLSFRKIRFEAGSFAEKALTGDIFSGSTSENWESLWEFLSVYER